MRNVKDKNFRQDTPSKGDVKKFSSHQDVKKATDKVVAQYAQAIKRLADR